MAPPLKAGDHPQWTAGTRVLYEKLRHLQIRLVRSEDELYDGSWAPEAYLSANFNEDLKSVGTAPPNTSSANAYKSADKQLNETYQLTLKTLAAQGDKFHQTAHRAVSRDWIKYRDAWAELGLSLYPKSQRADWLTWLTTERTLQLKTHPLIGPGHDEP